MTHAYPTDIKPLTGLRFIAAFWLLVYFFWGRLGIPEEATPGIVRYGYLGVDLFFVLSGFVLAHVYGPQVEGGRFHYGSFIWARVARIYPLHLLCLAAMIVLWIAGSAMGATFEPKAFMVEHIPFHVLLIHAWGFLGSDGWNFPSWSISAEWFAYLLFPVLFAVGHVFRSAPWAGLAAVVATFLGLFAITHALGMVLTSMTWQGGAVRIVPSFLLGVTLWFLGRKVTASPLVARLGAIGAVVWLIAVSQAGLSTIFAWPALGALVFFVAELSKHQETPPMGNSTWVYLGEISFAVYMIHLPVDIVCYQIVERLIGTPTGLTALLVMAAAMILTILAAAAAHALVEKPARNWLRANAPGPFAGRSKTAGA